MPFVFCEKSQAGKSAHDPVKGWGLSGRQLRQLLRVLRPFREMIRKLQFSGDTDQAGNLMRPGHLNKLSLRR